MLIGKVAELARGPRDADAVRARRRRALRRLPARPVGRDRRAAPAGRHHPHPLPRRGRRRARAPLRGEPAPPPAVRHRERVSDGIARERALLEPLVGEADLRVDTSTLNVHELRDRLRELFSDTDERVDAADQRRDRSATSTGCRSTSTSCSTAASSRTRTGSRSCARSPASTRRSATTCSRSAAPREFLDELDRLFALLLPGYEREGKAYLSIAFGCTGGRHRSVVIARAARASGSAASATAPRCTTGTSTVPADATRSVVALGGGHGLAVALQARPAVRRRDHRGRERRRRRRLVGPAAPRPRRRPRRAICARASSRSRPTTARGRPRSSTASRSGELAGHALGNLVIVGLAESLGDLDRALDEAGRLLGAVGPGRARPPSTRSRSRPTSAAKPWSGRSRSSRWRAGRAVRRVGHRARRRARRRPRRSTAIAARRPDRARPRLALHERARGAVRARHPGRGRRRRRGRVVHVANLRADAETAGLDGTDQLRVLLDHGVRVDVLLHDPHARARRERDCGAGMGVVPVAADIAASDGRAHDPARLATALAALL